MRKRGLVCSWKGASGADEVREAAAFQVQYAGPRVRVHLHGCYPTRSLADLAEEKARKFKGASRSGTPENTLGRSDFSPVVKNLARDLLRAVADGGDVPIAQVHGLARAVIEAPPFQIAQEVLQNTSAEFALRRALELAAMVLAPMAAQPTLLQRVSGDERGR